MSEEIESLNPYRDALDEFTRAETMPSLRYLADEWGLDYGNLKKKVEREGWGIKRSMHFALKITNNSVDDAKFLAKMQEEARSRHIEQSKEVQDFIMRQFRSEEEPNPRNYKEMIPLRPQSVQALQAALKSAQDTEATRLGLATVREGTEVDAEKEWEEKLLRNRHAEQDVVAKLREVQKGQLPAPAAIEGEIEPDGTLWESTP